MVAGVCVRGLAVVAVLVAGVAAAPRPLWAQAEPAPPGYVPPGGEPVEAPPSPIKWHIAVDGRLAVPMGSLPPALPGVGWGAGVQITRAIVDLGHGLRFGLGADFAYLRVEHDRGTPGYGAHLQFLGHTTFAALVVLDGIYGRVRPWLAAGGGFSVAQYRDPGNGTDPATNIDVVTVVGLIQLALGLDIAIKWGVDIGVGAQVDLTISNREVGAPPVRVFAPGIFSPRLGVGFRF
jgi:hypothetical protein